MTDFVGSDAKIFGYPCLLSGDILMDISEIPRHVYVYELDRDNGLMYEFTTLRVCHRNPSERNCCSLIFTTEPFVCDDMIVDGDPKHYAVVNESLELTGTASKFSSFLKREQRRKEKGRCSTDLKRTSLLQD